MSSTGNQTFKRNFCSLVKKMAQLYGSLSVMKPLGPYGITWCIKTRQFTQGEVNAFATF